MKLLTINSRYIEINIYGNKAYFKVNNSYDFLWWATHVIDKVEKNDAIKLLKRIKKILYESKDPNILYWFLRFSKDLDLFNLDNKIKEEIKVLIKKLKKRILNIYNEADVFFEKHLIVEPYDVITKYW